MLVADHLFFFFKVSNNLLETLFKDADLLFVWLDFIELLLLSLDILLFSALIDIDVSLEILI